MLRFWSILILLSCNKLLRAQIDESPQEIKIEKTIEKLGDYAQFIPVTVGLAATFAKKDRQGFWQLVESATTNITATYILKYAINKPRPEGKIDGHSFPSGHTSFAFQGASFLQQRYGWKYGAPAYLLASYVGYSRIEGLNDRHDGWDVLAGALVGIGSSYLFTKPYARNHFEMSAKNIEKGFVLGISFNF